MWKWEKLVGDIPFFICTYIYFTYNTDEEIIDFEI